MSVWLVVPVQSLRDGKTRLAAALDPAQRVAFVEWLLDRTLGQASQFPGLARTLVVSADEEVLEHVRQRGAQAWREEPPGGLNHAIRQAQQALVERGASRMLIVPSDLPLLTSGDLLRLATAASPTTIALAPDRTREGTNGLCLDVRASFDFSFGPNSFDRHLDAVHQLDHRSSVVTRTGLAFDVDSPLQLAELRALAPDDLPDFMR